MENKQIANRFKYSKCYWDNLNNITIVAIHSWQELDEDKKWKEIENIRISEIFRISDGKWKINQITDKAKCLKIIDSLRDYLLVNDWVFPRAFKDIYNEMKIQFKIKGEDEQLNYLKQLFTAI